MLETSTNAAQRAWSPTTQDRGKRTDSRSKQTGGDRKCEVERSRATSSEWHAYYERADEVRARFGDPLGRLIAQAKRWERLWRIVVATCAVVAMCALLWGALSILDDFRW